MNSTTAQPLRFYSEFFQREIFVKDFPAMTYHQLTMVLNEIKLDTELKIDSRKSPIMDERRNGLIRFYKYAKAAAAAARNNIIKTDANRQLKLEKEQAHLVHQKLVKKQQALKNKILFNNLRDRFGEDVINQMSEEAYALAQAASPC